MNTLEPYAEIILEYRQRKCPLALILEVLSHDYGLRIRFVFLQRGAQANRYSQSTLDTLLQRFDHDGDPVNTLPVQQSQLSPTP